MESLRKKYLPEIIRVGLVSNILSLPGTSILGEIKAIAPQEVQNQTRKQLPRIMNELSDYFPQYGIIKRVDKYFYLELPDAGNYIGIGSKILSITEVIDKSTYPNMSVYPPPSPVKTHVTLNQNLSSNEIGKRYDFELDLDRGIVSYSHEKKGLQPSMFDSHLYPIKWYVIYVKNLPEFLVNSYDPPHISIGVLG